MDLEFMGCSDMNEAGVGHLKKTDTFVEFVEFVEGD